MEIEAETPTSRPTVQVAEMEEGTKNSLRMLPVVQGCLRAAEAAVTGGRPRYPSNAKLATLMDVTWNGLELMLAGGKLISKRLGLALLLGVAFLVYVSVMEGATTWPFTPLCLLFGGACVVLSPPSRIALLDVKESAVDRVADFIGAQKLSERSLITLDGAIEAALARSTAWTGTLRGFMAIVWAVLFWFLCERVFGLDLKPDIRSHGMTWAAAGSLGLLAGLGLFSAYSAAASAIHFTLRLGLAQAKIDLAANQI
ncbi:hypothetical protein [Stenotrophomonas bentonitica]|nr:hypothetical protein [Stenotrophomonas bentonitica]